MKQRYHSVERTSPKGPGSPFIGRCTLCGKSNLPASAALEECENVRGLSSDETLLEAIEPPPLHPGDGETR